MRNTRDYGKIKNPVRKNFAKGGGVFYDYFGDPTEKAHINKAGGLSEGPKPPDNITTEFSAGESSTFNMPTYGYVPGRLLSGGLGGGDDDEKPKRDPRALDKALGLAERLAKANKGDGGGGKGGGGGGGGGDDSAPVATGTPDEAPSVQMKPEEKDDIPYAPDDI